MYDSFSRLAKRRDMKSPGSLRDGVSRGLKVVDYFSLIVQ
jgi:hypothetical protein